MLLDIFSPNLPKRSSTGTLRAEMNKRPNEEWAIWLRPGPFFARRSTGERTPWYLCNARLASTFSRPLSSNECVSRQIDDDNADSLRFTIGVWSYTTGVLRSSMTIPFLDFRQSENHQNSLNTLWAAYCKTNEELTSNLRWIFSNRGANTKDLSDCHSLQTRRSSPGKETCLELAKRSNFLSRLRRTNSPKQIRNLLRASPAIDRESHRQMTD